MNLWCLARDYTPRGAESCPVLCLYETVYLFTFGGQRCLFLECLTMSLTQRAGRAVKIEGAFNSNPGSALEIVRLG